MQSKPEVSLEAALIEEATLEQEKRPYQFAILIGLNRTGKHIYGGTVPDAVKTKRRKANKVASASRRKNRK